MVEGVVVGEHSEVVEVVDYWQLVYLLFGF